MADDEDYEEVVEYYTEETVYEEVPGETITGFYETTTTRTSDYEQSGTSRPALAQPVPEKPVERKRVIRKKVDPSKFMTPYIAHSQKMQDLFSTNKYKENYEKAKGKPYAITTDTPELRRIKKVQDQLSEVKYRVDGDVAKTICHVDEKAKDIEHAKKVSQQVSKVLYKQNWEDTKDKYLLPPDAPELVQAIKNTAMFSKKLYTEDWEADKTMFYPYNDSPELRRVAQAQKALSDIAYKKGLAEQQTQFTSLPDPPDIEFAKKVTNQVSKQKYKEDYENKVKGKWSETPCFEVATARMNSNNISAKKYQEDFEHMKDQIYFMQTETPEYKVNKQAGVAASKVKYKQDYEKKKGKADYNVLPASENPLLRQLKAAGEALSDKLYKENYEKTKAKSINYCETPKFKLDTVLHNFSSDTKYKDYYLKNILGHYVGSYEDPYHTHCMKVSAQNSDKNYKAEYEEDRGKGFFPQTITQEYEAIKKLDQCKDHTYKVHPDKTKFTQVTDSPVLMQAQVNSKQLSDLNYKAKHENEKFKCHIPPDTPAFIQHKVNAYNLSDNIYKHDWEKTKAKKFDIKVDAIPLLAAKANTKIASDVMYKKDYEKSKGKMIGALSINDDPKMLHSLKTAKNQSDRLYKENYEKTKAKSMNYCETPKYQLDTLLKNFSEAKYKDSYVQNVLGHYIGSFEDPYQVHCLKVSAQNSDKNYKAEYEEDKGKCYFPQTITQEYEAIKKLDQCKDHTYKVHPDKTKFTAVTDSPVLLQAQLNTKQLSDLNYKAKHEGEKFKCHIPADAPQFIQHRVNAYNLSDNIYKHDWEKTKAKKFDIKVDAIPLLAAKANTKIASDVMYKKDYEKSKGKMTGALSINDDPKMLHSLKTAKNQSDREYRKDYEKSKTIYTAPLDMLPLTHAKKSQAIASDVDYKHLLHNYSYPPDSVNVDLAKKAYALQSDVEYKADYNSWMKGCGWVPYGSLEMEKAKRASDILNEKKYRQHPDTLKFTSIEDAPIIVQSKINQAQRSDVAYKAKGEEVIHKYSLPADLPQFIQAKVNAYNISENLYKADLKDLSKKGYDLRIDAIPIKAAKAARQAASDVQYKKDYEKAKGKMVGLQSLQDDPKLVHYMNVAKIQSDREYKKDYEKTKTKHNTPHDMVNIVAAKKAQDVASNVNYKHSLHHYTYLPDAMDLELSKNMMHIQSDNVYKEDYNNWMRGIGWVPIGSLEVEKVKKAGDALNEKKYRQHPDTLKFTSIVDSPVMVQAKQNTQQVSDILYKAKGEDVKHKYTMSPDLPQFLQAKCNAYNLSDVCYKRDWHDLIAKGTNVLGDAIPITAAKASRNIASDYKYKEAYEKAKGKQVGFRSLQDDPKLVHYMNVAKLQSDREYKKNYENTKTSYHTPGDMVSITAAKMAQDVATNVNYKQPIHHYTYLPDALSLEHIRNVNQIQSDNVYKDEYNHFFKGLGWIPIGSLEVEKVKKAGDALNEKKYRQHPDTIKFTSVPDSMGMVLAQHNTKQLSDLNYKVEGEKVKHKYTMDPDVPQFIQAKVNAYNMSDSHYKADWKKTLAKGYDLRPDAIPIVAAKSSRNIASDFKYKEAYEKTKGKQIGFRSLQDDPKLVHFMNVAKMQSDREYKKGYEASKTRYHTPLDMLSVTAAKKSQEVATNMNYKQPFHHYTLLPDALNVEHSRNAMQIQSDNLYKSDFTNWMKGIGWLPLESLEVEKAKKAGEILSEKKYRQHPEKLKFTYAMDTMEQALNKSNKLIMDKRLYTEKWNKDKTTIHVMPDTPDILLSRVNQITMSDKLYKAGWEEEKKKGYDLRPDAIPIRAARASRDIASDYKYKQAYEQAKGKQIGFRSLEDDPKLVHFMQVAKMQSDREYKKAYEKSKTSFHTPVDMLSVVAAKKSQEVATNANYRNVIHTYNMLPDAMSLELAKNMMQIQSDNQYKADYADFMKGIGWLPLGSLEAEKNKKAMEIISEKKYRQHPDTLKYSTLMDSMNMVLAKNNAKIMNEHLYKQAWEADKTKVHIMPDIPQIILAKANAINISDKLYKLSLEEAKKKGYDLRTDAIPIKAAKASRDIASDYKYKHSYEKERGKMVGFRSLEDDPKLVHSMQVAKMQSDREYKKNYEKTKTSYHTPADMLSVTAAKDAQANITNTNYKHLIHKYILLPDAMNIQLSKNMNRIQSDNEYKQDYNEWYKGLGWSPAGSLEVEKAKKATEYASDQKYRQHPSNFQFTKLNDSMDMVLAKQNAHTMNKYLYTVDWNKDKTKIHVMPDTPDILQAKQNQTMYSQKLYKLGWEEALKKGYDLPVDAISVQAAKASRDIVSDFKYKQGYRKQIGHHIGFRSLQDDPKLVLSMNVAKMQSEREYKKDFEKWKTKFSSPVDMLGVVLAKKCQALVSDVDYKNYLHGWTCLPDQNDVIHAKKAYDLQSENLYKSDLEWLKGIGWSPLGSLEAEKNKRASEIISEKKYRQPPDRNKFTSIPDAMDIVLAKTNAKNRSDILYREAWDKDKTQIHIMPDTPDIILAKANLINTSDKFYRMGYEELRKKGYDLPVDAIPIKAAKASREIASEYKYKEGFRKQLGHHIGARNIEDDPKMMWSMHVAKIQSDREYKKDFEKWKTKFSSPVDMLGVVLAKKCQTLVSDIDYKNYLHQWTCLPDQSDVIHARQAYDLQSDNLYKSDLQWLRGIGWLPSGSVEDEKNKRASQILSDHVYRQHPDQFKFSSLMDSIPMVLAKNNAITMNHRLYTEAWDKDKTTVHIMPDTPEVLLAKQNQINYSEKLYKLGLDEAKRKGYDMRIDAIPIRAAKASRDIASEFKYKEGYRKQLGHHIGARAIDDDPKMMWSMHVAKIQSDREYKKDFEKWKTKFSSPVDMLGVVLAKKCQTLVSDIDYKNYLHQWTCLPDQSDVIHARQAYDLQSDNVYKSDLQWLRGIGWVPIGSLDVEKCKRASEILSDKLYRQPPDKFKFTSVTDSLEQVLAKNNAINMNKRLYTEAWDKDKTQVHIMPDTPEITLARMNKVNYSESLYKLAHEEAKKKGYDLRSDAIPIVAAKASRDIISDYKYKDGYRKQLGHHIGARDIKDDPKMMWSMHVAKIQSDREYKKDFEKWKTKFSSPVDMLGVVLAKKCQTLVSDIDYKNYLHQWTCLPDQSDVIHARQAYDLQSDNVYKSDLQWLRGIGWVPIESVDVIKCKRAAEILSDKLYRQPPDTLKFTSVPDSLEQVLAKNNAINMNKRLYTEAWDKDKTQIHIMPDTPEIMLARQNKLNYSETLYKLANEEAKKKGYDLRSDAIPIVAAKASRDIISDYKYKDGYRKQLGHHIGARNIEDDPKMMWSMHVAKIQSDREYKKDFEKWKTKFSSPVDMLGVVLAKKCQTLVSDIDYKNYLHQWTCLPDQSDVIHARQAYDLQSDNIYKSDLQWLRGIGWVPIGSVDVVKCKRAAEILSDNLYRQRPDTLKFTSVPDSLEQVLAKNNAINMNKRLYTEAWDKDKTQIHMMPDTPEITLARQNKINYSENLYRQAMEEAKKEGYDLRSDAIPIVAAKASREIASDYKYKEAYRKQLGHHIGARAIHDDPKMMWSVHVAKMQSDREYKKDFEKYKTRFSSPVDMLGIVLAKKCQTLVSDVDYKHPLHEWTCLPDQNDIVHARKAYDLQSDNLYKSDLEWLKGIGWVPIGSVEVLKAKRAGEILSDNIYRQRPDTLKFTSITDTPEQVLAKNNAINMNKRLYTEAWDNDKKTIHVMPDTPEIMLAKLNQINYSDKLYKLALEESRKEGYDLRLDAIPIQAAKASRDIASDYKYKEGYRRQLGHHIGARNIKDDPKMMWSIHAGKIQSDREYKKDFEKWKTKFSSPVDMMGLVQAKKCQILVSDIDYKNLLHEWTCLPDQNDIIQARKAYDLQSDAIYKADLEWLRGIGWVPIDSVGVEHVKRAGEILSERKYRQPAVQLKFTSITDTPEIVLAKNNALNVSKHLYTEAWDADKTSIHVMPDTPEILLAKSNSANISHKLYTKGWDESKMKDYDLRADAISIKRAKASRDIASDYKYKEAYEKHKGHHIGARSVEDDPRIMCAMNAGKIQSEREYKKEFQKWKTKFSSPVDMLGILLAKKCQTLVSDIDYRNYLHHWTCLPDQNDIIQARKAYDLQSDNMYKSDLEWLRGIGWMPEGSVEMNRVKNAQDLINERRYRTRPEALTFTSIVDTPEVVLAKANSLQMSEKLYQEAWNKDKSNISIPSDTPLILQAQINAMQISNKLYQKDWDEAKQKGYDLRADAIEIKHAKASREIASEYKYKEGYRRQLGHHIGARNIKDDPKMMWSIHAGKIQSDREYKKDFEKWKTKFSSPVDMMGLVQAKKCQILVSDIDYKNLLHEWTCLPDQNDIIQARKAYDLQSDAIYKADLEWLRGIGWVPIDSVGVEHVKRAGEILSERKYRQPAVQLKFTSITDTPEIVLAKNNALNVSKHLYTEAWDADKTSIHVMPDTPEILLAKSNSANISHKLYTKGWDESKMKDYDLRADAISIKRAKASRDIASDYKYKEAYEKHKGHHIGARSVEDDPRIMCAMNAGKIQSEREYKKEFQKWKTKFSSPVDMLGILLAKKCQTLVSDIDYRNYLHHWTCLPDQNDIIQARKAYDLQSDNVYKSDLEWLRGIGWMPEGSVEMNRVKNAQDLINEKRYRTRPEALTFTSIVDTPEVVLAKANSLQMSEKLYQEAWNKDKSNISIPSDTPLILQAQINAMQISNKLYQKDWDEAKQKGYDLRADAIEIKHAKASREIASEYKYKEGYRKQLGHHVGFRTLQDDPKLVWYIHAAKIQSDIEYKKAYEKSKGIHNTPLDMMSIVQAKKCQVLVSDIDYRNYLHQWICLPDQNDVIQAKKAYELQSDNVYKSDLEWLKGIGWLPEGSVEVMRVKNAQNLLNERLYRTRPEALKFTSIVDTPEVIMAKINSVQISEPLYRDAWEREKANVNIPADTPLMLQSKINAVQISNKQYQQAWEDVKMTGYDLKADAIGIQHAKASRDIASDYLYKTAYEKQKGHYIGCRNAKEDPKLVWAANVLKMQNDRLYKKAYNDHKAKITIPVDMVSINAAKEGQALASDVDYRHYLHQWSCFPDQNDVIQARKAYDLQSDAIYKADLEWLRGIGWMPEGSPEVLRVKNAQHIFRDSVYRTPVVKLKYTSIVDTPEVVLAKSNAENISIPKYREVWDKDKTSIHIMPDTPEINLARTNALNVSNKLYREGWDEMKMSCDVRLDAIPIQAAKASREIASDYKYKLDHEKQKGHYVGTRTARDDNKIRWALIAGKIQNEREYRLHWAKWKSKFQSPPDMLSIEHSKNSQTLVSDIDYRHYLHQWTCMPDQNDVIQARKAYDLQSDAIYKADLEWLRGIGWMPAASVSVNHAKHMADIFNEKKYRTKIETLNFTPVDDRVDYVTAKHSGEILNDIKYRKDWNDTKSKYTLTETPQLHTAQEAARILDQYLYKESWEKQKATGYILPPDAVPFVHAHHSGDVQSELKYKAEHVKQKGHYVGVPTMRDDPKLVWFEHAGQIQNDRLYKENYHKTKAKIHIPPDMVSVLAAKEGQALASDIDYRNYLHQWICHPDQNDVIQARKAYDLQSDNIYKADLEWLRGIGWIPLDSVDHVRVTRNQEMMNQIKYKKDALANYPNFTSVVDPPEIVLAKINSVNQSDVKYKETFNKLIKGKYIFSPDTPYITHSKDMEKLYSTILYKRAWDGTKAYGYTLDERYIPIVGAKHADFVNSELKYKETYEKLKGHYLAGKEISEFPNVVHCLDFQKMRSLLNYRRHYEDTKANVHIPQDMMNHVLAKRCQYILSDLEYRHYFHQWTSLPEEPNVVRVRHAQEILSDNVYKNDLNWLKGIGCYVWDTPQILHAKKSYDLQSQILYTAAGKENLKNYNLVTDTPLYVTALQSGINASEVKYKENYHQIKDKYTTVLETVDYDRTKNLKDLFSSNLYKEAWDKVKATSYILPPNTMSLTHAKNQKYMASHIKYREEYEKFKALYTLPRSVEDDPNTARCLRVGKFNIDRLYRSVYEKNKMKIHIVPDMVEMVTAKDSQKKVSEIDYRLHLHEWICHPDLQVNSHVRKVTDQISDIVYKDDLTWLKGIGCYVWDTPEILHAKHAYDLRNDIKYKAHVLKTRNNYKLVTDTPVYVQAVKSGKQLSDAVYHYDYVHSIRGRVAPTTKTVDLDRALHAYKLQSENLYRKAGLNALPTGYRLPVDTPHFKHTKDTRYMSSYFKYKEVYEHMKAYGYTLGPNDVPFVNVRRVNNVTSERLYRQLYHKLKDKIHTTPDTPEIRQVKKTQEAVSELIYKSDFFKMQGHMISLPYTPQVLHCRYVGDITSDIKYKEDLQILRGMGCFLYDTPDMVRSRHLRKLWSHYLYTDKARKMRDKYKVVLDTPEYRKVQELKTHLSELVYRAAGRKQKSIFTSVPDTPDLTRAKRGQKLQSQYLYVELATKERPHHHAGNQTTALKHARHVKDMVSENKYKIQYEKMKDKYTPVPDTPILIRAKRAYWNASDLRYKETFQKTKGKYHTVKDALDIVYHRTVTDHISKIKYKENYMSQLGIWRSIPDRPEHFHHRAVTDAVSDVKYKEDLTWLKGIGCYAYDTPDFTLAEKNKTLYSKYKYKEVFERTKSNFKYVADCPINRHFKFATQLMNERKYKSSAKMLLKQGCNEILRPDMLTALYNTHMWSQIKYRKNYEKTKDKFTSIVDTPEHLRTTKVNKQISDILYKLEYNKAKPRGYTTIHDTPMLLHVRKVKDEVSDLKYKEVYQRTKSNCTIEPDAVHIKAAKDAYKVNTNLDYKKKYEATKAYWKWTPDRPDFIQAAKSTLQQSDFEYKLDREYLKGCKLSVTDDKDMVLALKNSIIESDLKYKEKHVKERGSCHAVPDTPQILLAKTVSSLVSENKYKSYVKKHLAQGSYTTLPETRDTIHVKEVTKNVSDTNYKKKFVKEKGKSNYSIMLEPPDVKHAMDVAKKQSNVAYKKDAKENLHYTTVADRPDIKKATQAAKQASEVEYRAKHRKEGSHGLSMLGRPDIEMAKKAAKLSSQVQYRENFNKEKGKTPKYNPKDSQLYKVMKDANTLASEVKYKADLKKLHKPVTDMKESLIMNHVLNTSHLASSYQYKKNYEKSKGHYHTIPDNLEQLHLKEATELQSIVKYKEKYEKERGKPMLDFETPTYITAKESQQMQSGKEYRKDYEESIKGRNLTGLEVTPALLHVKYATKIASEKEYRKDLEESIRGKGLSEMEDTPDMLRAKNATQILNEKEYKRDLELEVKGRGLNAMANETPDFLRARNATDIASQIKYKQSAEMEKGNFTSVVDTPEIIHAQQVKNLSSQKKYKEDAEKCMSYYETVLDTPEMQRVRENQKNFSLLQYQYDLKNSKGKITVVQDTPEILRVKENQKNFSSVLYKEDVSPGTAIGKTPEMMRVKQTQDHISSVKYKEVIGQGTPIPDLPEVKRVKQTQKHISSVMYKENLGTGIPTPVTPEIERVKRNQENFSSVLYKENLGKGTPTPITPEMERVKRNQENFSSILYKENLSKGTPLPVTPEMERVKRNQENFSSVLYKENIGKGIPIPITPEMERVKHNQENFSSVLYKENLGTGIPVSTTPEMQRVKLNQENLSSVLYKENMGKGTPLPVTPEMERIKHNQENISSVLYKENVGKGTPTPVTPEMQRVKRNQENISSVLYKENMRKATPTPVTPEMERAKRNQENISSVLYSDSFRKQIQGKAAYVLDTPEMRRVRETQRHISTVKYHEDFEKHKGCFTPVVTDPITERVKKNTQDFSDICYRGIQRKVVEMEQKRNDQDQETITGLRVWRTNPGSVFDYDPAEDNIQSRSLHMINAQAQRRSREQSRSASGLSISGGEEKSEHSEAAHLSTYSDGGVFFSAASTGYKHARTTELPQQRSSSVATQQTTVSSIPSHPSTAGKIFRAMYDYMAADADEVSFKDGDAIVNVQAIDEGWMYGTVQRTGRTGMLPANYVEAI
ncbi:nebulin isoform X3 [Bubalus kerabau]|uniref:nebulin isoform X3 n=1 Tax=Bubalus carabanensis TaxID=3119969 RepID=UPI00244EAB23|nr:nebulin isoform X3 [Bubalus carabanensis]